jgi:hypothetical protein
MPNSTGEDDHHFGAIEAAIRETARGRAFLTDYARKVRQSDTLTMLATIARLERWCADQAARLAELERRDQASGGRPPQSQAGFGPTLHRDPAPMIGHGEQAPIDAAEVIQSVDGGSVASDLSREVRGRIEHLASAFCDFDRKAAEVSRHRRVTARFAEISPVRVGPLKSGAGALVPHAVVSRTSEAPSREGGVRQHVLEEDVLEGIAEALGTRKTADSWS